MTFLSPFSCRVLPAYLAGCQTQKPAHASKTREAKCRAASARTSRARHHNDSWRASHPVAFAQPSALAFASASMCRLNSSSVAFTRAFTVASSFAFAGFSLANR